MGLDEFRNEDFFVDDEEDGGDFMESSAPVAASPRAHRRSRRVSGGGMGLTPPQRLVLSVMLFMEVCIVGMFILIATGRVVPPGLY